MSLCQHISGGQEAFAEIKKIITTGLVICVVLSGISRLYVSDRSRVMLILYSGKGGASVKLETKLKTITIKNKTLYFS